MSVGNTSSRCREDNVSERIPFFFLIAMLLITGLGAAAYRMQTYDIPLLPATEAQVWQIEARIELEAQGSASQVFLTLPPRQSSL